MNIEEAGFMMFPYEYKLNVHVDLLMTWKRARAREREFWYLSESCKRALRQYKKHEEFQVKNGIKIASKRLQAIYTLPTAAFSAAGVRVKEVFGLIEHQAHSLLKL